MRFPRLSQPGSNPSERMFRHIRWRLVAWYTGVLAAALLVFAVALYFGARQALISPVDEQLQESASTLVIAWEGQPDLPCPPTQHHLHAFWGCYSPRGTQLYVNRFTRVVPHFNDPALAQSAIRNGTASDELNGGPMGTMRAYAVSVHNPRGSGILGVVQVAEPVGGQTQALAVLLKLLLALGLGTLVLTFVGGLFLAHRSLLPARLAHARQRNFIADASHELRTPLTMLRADAEVLLRGRQHMNPDDVLLLEDVVAETEHMTNLANTMLNLAQMDAGETHPEREVVNLNDVVHEIAQRAGALAAERQVGIEVESGPPILVLGDHLMLNQAVLVLIDNAIKYNRPNGSVILRVRLDGTRAVLEIRDTGIGIAPEHLPHLGERFYRVDRARSREAGGAGLGVSIARGIAAAHGGSLQITSTQGEGTIAVLSLPAIRPNVQHAVAG